MKARTIATVAAAGLAALVSGCGDKHQRDEPYFNGLVDVDAPACGNSPEVVFGPYQLRIICGDYDFNKLKDSDHSCSLIKRTADARTFMYSNVCNGTLDDATWESHIPESQWIEAYKIGLTNVGAPEIGQIWKQWRENWKLVNDGKRGTQELQVNAPYCNNLPHVTMEPDRFEIECGGVVFTHKFSEEFNYSDTLKINARGEEITYSDYDGNGEVDYLQIKYNTISSYLTEEYAMGLADIGYEDIQAKYYEWLKKQ